MCFVIQERVQDHISNFYILSVCWWTTKVESRFKFVLTLCLFSLVFTSSSVWPFVYIFADPAPLLVKVDTAKWINK